MESVCFSMWAGKDFVSESGRSIISTTSIEELLNERGYIVYTNIGYSMMPLLRQKKDVIEIRKKEPGRCKKYDVVLYKQGNRYILHRILRVLPEGYIIAGDHNTFLETDVTDGMILGVMTRVIRDGKDITPDNIWYKLYVHLWCDVYPVRMMILKGKMKVRWFTGGVKRRILRLVKRDA